MSRRLIFTIIQIKNTNMQKEIKEVWYPIYGYEGYYEISINGKVRSLERIIKLKKGTRKLPAKIIKPRINNCGYKEVRLSKYGIINTRFVHVLLGEVFIPNPYKKPEINHLNGLKTDNRIDNLEWCTHAENMQHAYANKLIKHVTKKIIDNCTGAEFESTKEAAKVYNIKLNTLRCYLNGGIKTNPTCLKYAA